MEELEQGVINSSGVPGDVHVLPEAAKDDIVPEPRAEKKRPRSPSPPPRTPSPPPPAPTPAVATPKSSRARTKWQLWLPLGTSRQVGLFLLLAQKVREK